MKRLTLLVVVFLTATTFLPARAQTIAEPTALIDNVLADLSARLNRRLTRVTVTYQYNLSRYANASLDCPVPGRNYATAATNGWQILIMPSVGGTYDYRAL